MSRLTLTLFLLLLCTVVVLCGDNATTTTPSPSSSAKPSPPPSNPATGLVSDAVHLVLGIPELIASACSDALGGLFG